MDILTHRAHAMIGNLPSWKPSGSLEPDTLTLVRLIMDVLRRNIHLKDQLRVMQMLRMLDQLCRTIPFVCLPDSCFSVCSPLHDSLHPHEGVNQGPSRRLDVELRQYHMRRNRSLLTCILLRLLDIL